MFFKTDDNDNYDYTTICSKIQEECSDLIIKQKLTQIKVLTNNEKNNSIYNNNKVFNIKVKSKLNIIKSQGWRHS